MAFLLFKLNFYFDFFLLNSIFLMWLRLHDDFDTKFILLSIFNSKNVNVGLCITPIQFWFYCKAMMTLNTSEKPSNKKGNCCLFSQWLEPPLLSYIAAMTSLLGHASYFCLSNNTMSKNHIFEIKKILFYLLKYRLIFISRFLRSSS